jgi:hypothetical protein
VDPASWLDLLLRNEQNRHAVRLLHGEYHALRLDASLRLDAE